MFGLYGFLKQPSGPVPPECIELHNTTAPWNFSVPGEGKVVLHELYPQVLIEEQAMLTLQRQSSMYKWFIFIQLLGGERGLFRLSSIWVNDKSGQMMEVLGKNAIFALDQHVVDVVKAGILALAKSVPGRNVSTKNFLSTRFSSWRGANAEAIRAEGALPKKGLKRSLTNDSK
ncbi:hypothetical protein RvY_18391 [Ramazzottius varieornatus]|uniref:Uncharacterized protein n=1 Tax=Ramazzottius varieornatus TaxID=947166 RepID=A0A1D1W5L5_RAMVA|nr:hypothetical protein RvY_18391 [Ramazzottius varieornatus]